jgi:hypothetical protein
LFSWSVHKAMSICRPNLETHTARQDEIPNIIVMGYVSTVIMQLGPSYKSVLGSFEAAQDWLASWRPHYSDPEDLRILRIVNEEYWAKVTTYGESEMAKIRGIHKPSVMAWRVTHPENMEDSESSVLQKDVDISGTIVESEDRNTEGPVLFLGTGNQIGIVPEGAMINDAIVRFWGCDTALLMRPTRHVDYKQRQSPVSFSLEGRADVVGPADLKKAYLAERDTHAEKMIFGEEGAETQSSAVWVRLDLKTLQNVTTALKG